MAPWIFPITPEEDVMIVKPPLKKPIYNDKSLADTQKRMADFLDIFYIRNPEYERPQNITDYRTPGITSNNVYDEMDDELVDPKTKNSSRTTRKAGISTRPNPEILQTNKNDNEVIKSSDVGYYSDESLDIITSPAQDSLDDEYSPDEEKAPRGTKSKKSNQTVKQPAIKGVRKETAREKKNNHSQPFPCYIDNCTKGYRRAYLLKRHQLESHGYDSTKDITEDGEETDGNFNKQVELKAESRKRPNNDNEEFEYEPESDAPTAPKKLRGEKDHTTGLYTCLYCGEGFERLIYLNAHVQAEGHGEVIRRARRRPEDCARNFECQFPNCDKGYETLPHLNNHIQVKRHGKKFKKADWEALIAAKKDNSDDGGVEENIVKKEAGVHGEGSEENKGEEYPVYQSIEHGRDLQIAEGHVAQSEEEAQEGISEDDEGAFSISRDVNEDVTPVWHTGAATIPSFQSSGRSYDDGSDDDRGGRGESSEARTGWEI